MTCESCRHFKQGECRESPPQVFAVVVPGKPKGSIVRTDEITINVEVSCAYPHVDILKPCSRYRAALED